MITAQQLVEDTVLSRRQAELYVLEREGLSDAEIARVMGVEVETVATHRRALEAKLEAAVATAALADDRTVDLRTGRGTRRFVRVGPVAEADS